MKRMTALLLGFAALFFLAALACLRRWGSPEPWSRLDIFSGGYLLLSLVWLYDQHVWHKTVFRTPELLKEAAGASFDPLLIRAVTFISLAELTVFLDYAHWRLTPALEIPWLQCAGLALSASGVAWLFWTDKFLIPSFAGDLTTRHLITSGPYALVRHPRYVALLVSRIAFALIFASALAWGFVLIWVGFIVRRIRLEDAHLRGIFGAEYDSYAARTARLLPGIY